MRPLQLCLTVIVALSGVGETESKDRIRPLDLRKKYTTDVLQTFHSNIPAEKKHLYKNHTLVCQCTIGCHCNYLSGSNFNDVCITNGSCYTSFNSGKTTYSCVDAGLDRILCRAKRPRHIACCKEHSFCSSDLDFQPML